MRAWKGVSVILAVLLVVSACSTSAANKEQAADDAAAEIQEIQLLVAAIQAEAAQLQREAEQAQLADVSINEREVYPYLGIPETFTFERDLSHGMKGEDAFYLQIFLNNSGCVLAQTGVGSPGNETRTFWDLTREAVICFQEKYPEEILEPWGLTEGTGFFGPFSRAKANQLLEEAREARNQFFINLNKELRRQRESEPTSQAFWQTLGDLLEALDHFSNVLMSLGPQGGALGAGIKSGTTTLKGVLVSLRATNKVLRAARKTAPTAQDVSTLRQTTKDVGYFARLGIYLVQHGKAGLDLLESAGAQIGKIPRGFIDNELLNSHFRKHGAKTGVAWEGQQFKTAQDYLGVAISIIKNPNAKKVLYYHQGKLDDPTLGYLLEKDGKVFLVAVSKEGNIKTFHHLEKGWEAVRTATVEQGKDNFVKVFDRLFEVDPIP